MLSSDFVFLILGFLAIGLWSYNRAMVVNRLGRLPVAAIDGVSGTADSRFTTVYRSSRVCGQVKKCLYEMDI